MKPVIFGCSGLVLTAEERDLFAASRPFGFILFQRNCASPDQVRQLVSDLRASVDNRETPVFIDQEGGRVARLKPPHWPKLPPMRMIGQLYESDKAKGLEAMRLHSRITAHMLKDLGINGNCAPVLDLFIEGASSAIGDRAISRDPRVVEVLGKVAVETYLEHGVFPVIKHLPGHGRVEVDPHEFLPIVSAGRSVLENEDFLPFKALENAPFGMNCHVVFKELDPDKPVSLSANVHSTVIREQLGFEGLIMSDDLAMKALKGSPADNAVQTLAAGADIALYCPGDLTNMRAIANAMPDMEEEPQQRWASAKRRIGTPEKKYASSHDRKQLDTLLT